MINYKNTNMSLENDFEDLEEMIESEGEGEVPESDSGYESEFESDNDIGNNDIENNDIETTHESAVIESKNIFEPTNLSTNSPTMTQICLTVYERTSLIGLRAQQISEGALSFLPFEEAKAIMNPLLIAEEEFKRGYIVYDIVRKIQFGKHIREIPFKVNGDLLLNNVGNMV